jgi:outer membrane biogenesis lipoprotein LolB
MSNAANVRTGVHLPVSSLRAGLYGRNSKGLDKSIDDQIVEGRQAAGDNGWSLVEEYSDGVSASRFGTKGCVAGGSGCSRTWTTVCWMW